MQRIAGPPLRRGTCNAEHSGINFEDKRVAAALREWWGNFRGCY